MEGLIFIPRHPAATVEHFGMIPMFLVESDPRPVKEQFDDRYRFGGGWRPFAAWRMLSGDRLKYPGDPPQEPIAELRFRDERIVLYRSDIVAIIQPDGSFEASRMD